MAYQIDFTASNHEIRRLRKTCLRVFVLAAVAGVCWGVYTAYRTYTGPTLNMKLKEYESVAHKVEDVNRMWDEASAEWNAVLHYYRLVWADSCTNFLAGAASSGTSLFGPGYKPKRWTLKTGGPCKLEYAYSLQEGSKTDQASAVSNNVVRAVESVVNVAAGGVSVAGIQTENLRNLDALDLEISFSLKEAKKFREKSRNLSDCVKEIEAMRKLVLDTRISDDDSPNARKTAREMMMHYLPKTKDGKEGPAFTNAIDVSGWFDRADRFARGIPGFPVDKKEQNGIRAAWNKVGEARYPWERFTALDNETVVQRKEALEKVASKIGMFKPVLWACHTNCQARLEPFVTAYDLKEVSNENLTIKNDLVVNAAHASGIVNAAVEYEPNDPKAPRAELEKDGKKYTFVWVKWKLLLADSSAKSAVSGADGSGDAADALTVAKVAECARKLTGLGPGYALDEVKVEFAGDGRVSTAVLTGLLPVKTVKVAKTAEVPKEESGNVER